MGYDVADEVIAAVAKRIRSQLRGKDHLGRFSGNKFGIDPQQLHARRHADRRRPAARQRARRGRAHQRRAGRRHRDDRRRDGATPCAQCPRGADARTGCARRRQGSSVAARSRPTGRIPSAMRSARRTCARPTRSSPRSTSAASSWPTSRSSTIGSRKPAFYECLMRVQRSDGSLLAVNEAGSARRTARPGAAARSSRARAGARGSRSARPRSRPASTSRPPPPSTRTGGRRSSPCCARIQASPSASRSRSPRRRRSTTSMRRVVSSRG